MAGERVRGTAARNEGLSVKLKVINHARSISIETIGVFCGIALITSAVSCDAQAQEKEAQSTQLPPVYIQQAKKRSNVGKRQSSSAHGRHMARLRRHNAAAPVTASAVIAIPSLSPLAAVQGEASEAAGYKPTSVANFGLLGRKAIEDVPYSVNVVPHALIENTNTTRNDDLFTMVPGVQASFPSTRSFSNNFILRGYTQPFNQGKAEDGLRFQNLIPEPLEDKERVEVFYGLTSFLFGPNNVGGLTNYVYKRPTTTPFGRVTVGDVGGASGYVHGDFGGPVDKAGQLYYRFNLVGQDGDTAVDKQSIKRNVLTGALSYRPTKDFDLTIIGSHTKLETYGADVFWNFATNPDGSSKVFHVAAPDATKNFGQPWSQAVQDRNRIGADLTWQPLSGLTFRSGYGFNAVTVSNNIFANNTVSTSGLTYSQTALKNADVTYLANSGYSAIDGEFDTSFVHHKVTAGYYANNYEQAQAPTTYASSTFTNFNFITPTYVAMPTFAASNIGPVRTSTQNTEQSLILGDDIKFNRYWSALVGVNYAMISGQNFNTTTGAETSAYSQSHWSPSGSIIFKPVSWLSLYGTYSESLQPGRAVINLGGQVFTNSGQTLPPFVGRSVETGIKANVGGMLVTLAYFDIDQALLYNRYNNDNTYTAVEDGRQRDKGIELDAVGTIFPGLRVFGGLTLLDPRVEQSQTSTTAPSINGLRPTGVSSVITKVTTEYDLPFIPGITLTGGIYHYGTQAVDRLNTELLPPYTIGNVGFRYRTVLPTGNEFVLRFNVLNVTNESYWLQPNYVGQPRTYTLTASARF